jgi:hypothetical protein
VDKSYELCCLAHAGFYDSAVLAAVKDEPFAIAGGASAYSAGWAGDQRVTTAEFSCCQNARGGDTCILMSVQR